MTEIDYSQFGDAVARLAESLAAHKSEPKNSLARDSVISRYEFTYELSHKMLRRFFLHNLPSSGPAVEMTFPTLVRTASEYGLISSGWDRWRAFREARNETSHAYNEEKAVFVAAQAADFLEEAQFLYKQLLEKSA